MVNIEQIQNIINYTFKDEVLIKRAFIHRSYPNEHPDKDLKHNERLEFLGDAVLELVVTEYLYALFPEEDEGILTNYRAAIVKTDNLALICRDLGLKDFLCMSKGELSSGSNNNDSILADLLESVIGAIYLDSGYSFAKEFIEKVIIVTLKQILENNLHIDPKSEFQNLSQLYLKQTPKYEIISETGKDHEKIFEAVVKVQDEAFGTGTGKSKQLAETSAARNGLSQFDKYKAKNLKIST